MSKRLTVSGLETICWIARLGSFTAAAERLLTTQPAISARVRDLEAVLKIQIFERRGRGVELTIEGRELMRHAEPLYRQFEDFTDFIGRADATTGTVRIGAGNIVMSWFPALVTRLHEDMPRLLFDVEIGNAQQLLAGLDAGRLDMAIIPRSVDPARYTSISLGFEHMLLVSSPDVAARIHRADQSVQLPEDLQIWSVPATSFFYTQARAMFRPHQKSGARVNTINNMAAAKELVINGVGAGLLPRTLIANDLASGRLVVVSDQIIAEPVEFFVARIKQDSPGWLISRIMQAAVDASTLTRTS